jgi:hypothetical protein
MSTINRISRAQQQMLRLLLLAASAAFLTGCATTHKVQFTPSPTARPPHPLKVALVLNDELRNHNYAYQQTGSDVFKYPIGAPLSEMAGAVARDCFAHVNVVNHAISSGDPAKPDAILVPRLIKISQHMPLGLNRGDDEALMIFEWTLRDADGDQLIWLKTTKVVASERTKNAGHRKRLAKELIERAMTDTHRQSVRAIQSSFEIRKAAAVKEP